VCGKGRDPGPNKALAAFFRLFLDWLVEAIENVAKQLKKVAGDSQEFTGG